MAKKKETKPKVKTKIDMLKATMAKINASFGEGTIGTLTEKAKELAIEFIETRSAAYNSVLHGGLAKGRISEIYGPSDSGKTSILLDTIGYNMTINPDFTAGWFETEGHFDMEYATKTFGIDPERFAIWSMSDYGAEKGLDILESFLRSSTLDILVVNTVAGLTPKTELDADMEKQHMALQARMMSKLMRKIVAIATKTNTHVSFINQIRSDIGSSGPMGAPNVTPGGAALKFYSSQRIMMKNGFMKAEDTAKGYDSETFKRIDVQVKKNRMSTGKNPYQKCSYYIEYGVGIDTIGEIPMLVEEYEVLKKSGSWFFDIDSKGKTKVRNGVELKWQGKGNFRDYLNENPDYVEELRERIALAGASIVDVQAMDANEIEAGKLEDELAEQTLKDAEALDD